MSSLSLIPAIANKLKATASVIAELPDGANGIVPAFSLVGDNFPSNLNLPAIVLKDGGTYGMIRQLPHMQATVMLHVYDNAHAPNQVSYARIDQILWECINTLHDASLTMEASYYAFYEILFDNYISSDLFDSVFKLPYKVARFRAFLATHLTND